MKQDEGWKVICMRLTRHRDNHAFERITMHADREG